MTTPVDDLHKRTIMAAGALAEHATGELRGISGLTDEEILALVSSEDLEHFDLPWVTAREKASSAYSRDEVRVAALRSLIVRGGVSTEQIMAAVEGRETGAAPQSFTPSALLSGILARRALAPRALRVSSPEGEPSTTTRTFIDTDLSVMHEMTSPDGLHHFFMSDLDHAADAIVSRIDPEGVTPVGPVLGELVTGSWRDLEQDPSLGPLLASAQQRCRITLEDRREGVRTDLSVAVGERGSIVLRGAADGATLEAVAVSAADLRELVSSLLDVDGSDA